MPTYKVEEPPSNGNAAFQRKVVRGEIGPQPGADERAWVTKLRAELDQYWAQVREFHTLEPDQVMIAISAITARAGEVRVQLCRDNSRVANRLRLDEVDPLIEECKDQFKIHSRLLSVRELDWNMTRGAPS